MCVHVIMPFQHYMLYISHEFSRLCYAWFSGKYSLGGLVHDCNNSIANALELLQFCTKLPV